MHYWSKFSKINHLKVLQLYRNQAMAIMRIRRKARKSNESKETLLLTGKSSDGKRQVVVPRGYLAVYVGPEQRRFVIPASYLSQPDFRDLMESVEEEFGFEHEAGLQIPCEEEVFEKVLIRCLEYEQIASKKMTKKNNVIANL